MRHAIVIARKVDGSLKTFISPDESTVEAEALYHKLVQDHSFDEVQFYFRPQPHWFHRPAEEKHNRDQQSAYEKKEAIAKAAREIEYAKSKVAKADSEAAAAKAILAQLTAIVAPVEKTGKGS